MRRNSGEADEMRPEYDFSGGVRGKYAECYRQQLTAVVEREGAASSACARSWTSPVRASRLRKRERIWKRR
jgi:hypothetical protein